MVMLQEASQLVGILIGVTIVAGGIITLLAFALRRAKQREETSAASNVLQLQKEEIGLLRERAGRIPELETQVKVLREEVGASRAIAQLEANMQTGFAKMSATLDAMDRRGQKADRWQARFNRGTVEGLNRLLAKAFESPIRIDSPDEERGS